MNRVTQKKQLRQGICMPIVIFAKTHRALSKLAKVIDRIYLKVQQFLLIQFFFKISANILHKEAIKNY